MAYRSPGLLRDNFMQLTDNFNTTKDLQITGGVLWEDLEQYFKANLLKSVENLQAIRDHLGLPVKVTSGLRTGMKNASLAGSSNTSQHLFGEALDFQFKGQTWELLEGIVKDILNGTIKVPHPCSQVIVERKPSNGAEWIHIAICTERWLKINSERYIKTKEQKFKMRETHCEFMRTYDTVNFDLLGRLPYSDF